MRLLFTVLHGESENLHFRKNNIRYSNLPSAIFYKMMSRKHFLFDEKTFKL